MSDQSNVRMWRISILVGAALLVSTGCAGSGSQVASPAIVPNVASPTSTGAVSGNSVMSIPLSAGERSSSLELNDGNSATIRFSVAQAPAAAAALATVIPVPSNAQKTLAGSTYDETFVGTINLTVDANVTLNQLPGFTLARAEFIGAAPRDISYTVYDGADCTSVVGAKQFASKLDGTSATFAPSAGAVHLVPGHSYLFVFSVKTPHVPKYWTIGADNAILGYDIDGNRAVLKNRIAGSNTKMQNVQDVAVTADRQVVALDVRPPSNQFDPYPYEFDDKLISFPIAGNGNIVPLGVISTPYADAIGTSPNGKRLFGVFRGNRRDGGGRTFSLLPTSSPLGSGGQGNYVINDAAQSDDGTFAIQADSGCIGCAGGALEFSVVTIGDRSSSIGVDASGSIYTRHNSDGTLEPANDLHDHYAANAIALDPNTGTALVAAFPKPNVKPIIEVYNPNGFLLGAPLRSYTLPERVERVSAIRIDANGTVYLLALETNRTEILIYQSASNLSQPKRTVDLGNFAPWGSTRFAISR